MRYPYSKHEAIRTGYKTQIRPLVVIFQMQNYTSLLLDHSNPTLSRHSTEAAV